MSMTAAKAAANPDPQPSVGEEEEDAVMVDNDDDDDSFVRTDKKPRQWIIDRCNGQERVMAPGSRPFLSIFWTPPTLKCFPDYLETNCVMERLGAIGFIKPHQTKARRIVMTMATIATMAGWICMVYSDFAISKKHGPISVTNFNAGIAEPKPCLPWEECEFFNSTNNEYGLDRTLYLLGLRAVALTRGDEFGEEGVTEKSVLSFDDFCGQGDLGIAIVLPDRCSSCAEASNGMVNGNIMGTITYFFTLTTDILRLWPNYDVNCQKVFGAFFAMISTALGIRTWILFQRECYQSFYFGDICFDTDINEVDCDDPGENFLGSVFLGWTLGPGLIALGVATFAKLFDLLCNLAIQTPTITRDLDEQWEYERIAHKALKEEAAEAEEEDNDAQ